MADCFIHRNDGMTQDEFVARCIYNAIKAAEDPEAVKAAAAPVIGRIEPVPLFDIQTVIESINGLRAEIAATNKSIQEVAQAIQGSRAVPEAAKPVPLPLIKFEEVGQLDLKIPAEDPEPEGEWVSTIEAQKILSVGATFFVQQNGEQTGIFKYPDCPKNRQIAHRRQRLWDKNDLLAFRDRHPEFHDRSDPDYLTTPDLIKLLRIPKGAFYWDYRNGRYGKPDIPSLGTQPAMWELERARRLVFEIRERKQKR